MKAASTYPPLTLHGLPVLTPAAATLAGYHSITVDIAADSEERILSGVCQFRNPQRCCLAATGNPNYQLCILREDVRGADTETD